MSGADGGAAPDYLSDVGCIDDFQALASEPLDATIPGARSGKVVLDQFARRATRSTSRTASSFQIHYEFASKHLSGPALTRWSPPLAEFNRPSTPRPTAASCWARSPTTRGPKVWALEMAPYDTASADDDRQAVRGGEGHAYFGGELAFHPTSEAVEAVAAELPAACRCKTTDELFAEIDYQPLNLGDGDRAAQFVKAADLDDHLPRLPRHRRARRRPQRHLGGARA